MKLYPWKTPKPILARLRILPKIFFVSDLFDNGDIIALKLKTVFKFLTKLFASSVIPVVFLRVFLASSERVSKFFPLF